MHTWIRYGLIVLACGMLLTGIARPNADDAEVTDGPSRRELFEARLAEELGPLGALAAAAAPPFFLPTDVKGDAIFGIDVSHHNDENCKCTPGQICTECKIDWSRAQDQKVSFVYLKASQGTAYRDPTFGYHWRTLARHNIARGAYHFMSADEDPVVQADNFVDKMEEAGKLQPADMPPCLDLEADKRKDKVRRWFVDSDSGEIRDFWSGQDPEEILNKVTKWLKRVEERTGRTPIIYTSRGWWNDRIKDEKKIARLQRYPIWIANYPDTGSPLTGKPKVPNKQDWTIWQFTESGRVKNSEIVPGPLDINIFNGTLGNFHQALGMALPEKKEIVRLDEPKDTGTPAQQATETNPSTPTDTGTPAQQATETNPSTPTDTSTPAQQATGTNPSTPTDTGTPAQQATETNPSMPPDTGTPAQQATETNPSTPTDASTPAQQATETNPSTPKDTGAPAQQATGSNPSMPPDTGTPAQQATGTNPSTPPDTGTPAQQATGTNPSEPAKSSNPQVAVVNPNDSKPNTATATPRTNASSRSQRTSSRISSQKVAAENSQKLAAEKMIVEIVLVNGRTIRVDANIDPTILSRLITAVDGN